MDNNLINRIYKFSSFGIQDALLKWLTDFLCEWKQRVSLRGVLSLIFPFLLGLLKAVP